MAALQCGGRMQTRAVLAMEKRKFAGFYNTLRRHHFILRNSTNSDLFPAAISGIPRIARPSASSSSTGPHRGTSQTLRPTRSLLEKGLGPRDHDASGIPTSAAEYAKGGEEFRMQAPARPTASPPRCRARSGSLGSRFPAYPESCSARFSLRSSNSEKCNGNASSTATFELPSLAGRVSCPLTTMVRGSVDDPQLEPDIDRSPPHVIAD